MSARGFPEDSIQYYVTPWWTATESREVVRGRLIWTLALYPDQKPSCLVPESRGEDDTDHRNPRIRIEPFDHAKQQRAGGLPIAAFPVQPGESLLVSRGKWRPCIVLSTGGRPVEKNLRPRGGSWQTSPRLLIAPYFGVEADGGRGGWNPELTGRIRRAEYPQYILDRLPLKGPEESILRLDQIFPIGQDKVAYSVTEHCLSGEALEILDDWVLWLMSGKVTKDGPLAYFASELRGL